MVGLKVDFRTSACIFPAKKGVGLSWIRSFLNFALCELQEVLLYCLKDK